MNSLPVFRLSQLSVSVSKTTVRHGSMLPRRRTAKPELSNFPAGHGEQIWVWNHMNTKQVIYSHTKSVKANHAMKQLPFIAKKSKPSKLRRDLWAPMALIQFPPGAGVVGQNAFQKLREFRKRHELEWSDDVLYKTEEKKGFPDEKQRTCRTRVERGHAVHAQRANAIADIAAVLAGRGRGNRLWLNAEEVALLAEGKEELRGARWSKMGPAKHLPDGRTLLVDTKVYWKNQDDVNYAEKWSDNVVHESLEEFEARQAAEAAEAEAAEAEAAEAEAAEAEAEAEVVGEEAAVEKPAEEATKA